MKKLSDKLSQFTKLKREEAESEKLENKARSAILEAARSNLPLETAKQKILDSRVTLDIVCAEQEKIIGPLNQATEELRNSLRGHISAWNSGLLKGRAEMIEQIIEALQPFFEDGENEARAWIGQMNVETFTGLRIWREAFYDDMSLRQRMSHDLIGTVKDFLRHMDRHSAILGIDLSSL